MEKVLDAIAETKATLLGLPIDVLAIVLDECDLPDIGNLSAACSTFWRLTSASSHLWDRLCRRHGLFDPALPPTPSKARLRRAALCNHAQHGTVIDFDWSRLTEQSPAGDAFRATCAHCGRPYKVSKEVWPGTMSGVGTCRVHFSALHEAPRQQQAWSVVWDRKAVAAMVKAVLLTHTPQQAERRGTGRAGLAVLPVGQGVC